MGGLKNLLHIVLEARHLRSGDQQGQVLGGELLTALHAAGCLLALCSQGGERQLWFLPLLVQTHHGGSIIMTSSKSSYPWEAPPPNTIPLGIKASK